MSSNEEVELTLEIFDVPMYIFTVYKSINSHIIASIDD